MLHVRSHVFHEFLSVQLLFLPDTAIIMTLLQYFVFALLIPYSYEDKTFGTALNNASTDQWH